MDHSICVSEKTLSAIIDGKNALPASASLEEVMKSTECKEEELKHARFLLICGTAHKLFTSLRAKTSSNQVLIHDSGTHTCDATCDMKQVDFSMFTLPGNPERVHVCLGAGLCFAPAECHCHKIETVKGCLFVCATSNACHICTDKDCDAVQITTDSYVCCSLTGNVLCRDEKLLSNGWIEDEWRSGLACPSYNEHATVLQSNKDDVPGKAAHRRSTQYRHLPGSHLVGEWWGFIHHVNIPRLGTTGPIGIPDTDRQQWIIDQLHGVAATNIRHLLPGSGIDKQVKTLIRSREITRFARAAEKYIRHRQNANLPLCMQKLTHILRRVIELRGPGGQEHEIQLDESKACSISHGYADAVVCFLRRLLEKTEFVQSEIAFDDFVCATMYLQTSHFRVAKVSIFKPDPFLVLLPLASQLSLYGYKKSAFTGAKGAIQSAIFEAAEAGVDVGLLTFPTLSFSALYL